MSVPNLLQYSIKYLALPDVKLFSSRAEYEAFAATHPILKNQPVRPPNVNEPPKLWIDLKALEHPELFVGQVRYKNVLATGSSLNTGSPWGQYLARPIGEETDLLRRQFYADYVPKTMVPQTIPYFDSWNMTVKTAASVNIPPGTFDQTDAELAAWAGSPPLPFPCRPLDPDEAFRPSGFPSSELIVVNTNLWRAAFPQNAPTGDGFCDSDRMLLRRMGEQLDQILLQLSGGSR